MTEDDERAGRERVAMQRAAGLDVAWLDAAEAAATAVTLCAGRPSRRQLRRGRRRRSTRRATSAPTRSRCRRRASSCASGRRSPACARPTGTDGTRVVAVETDAGAIETERVLLTGGPSLRSVGALAGVRIPVGAARHTVAVLEPHPAFDVETMPMVFDIGEGLYWRLEEGGLLFGWSDPRRDPRRGALDRLGVLRDDAGAAGRLRPG